eukprot:2657252-Ditylum_brightwellii.AAC.1
MGITLPTIAIPDANLGNILSATVEEQMDLLWDNFTKGRVLLLWKEAQDKYIQIFHPKSSYTNDRWAE